jgi:PAS domain S-box-containing protein
MGMARVHLREGDPAMPREYAVRIPTALRTLNVPAYVLDPSGRIRWLNDAARAIGGDLVGRYFTSLVAPESLKSARKRFERTLRGEAHDDFIVDVEVKGEQQRLEISSVPIGGARHAVGIFGLARPASRNAHRSRKTDGRLTRRQHEVLEHLAEGASTDDIARELVVSRETIRNHVRHILQRLGVRSRLAAIAVARRDGLV